MRKTLIVIPASGNVQYTRLAIDSIRRSSSGVHMVLVETDAEWKTDDDLDVVRLDGFVSFSHSVNCGLTFAANGAALQDNFDHVVVLNNDVAVTSGWLQPLLDALASGYCIAGPVTNSCGHGEQNVHPDFSCIEPKQFDQSIADRFAGTLSPHNKPVFAVVGLCMAFRAELVEQIGLFDERFLIGNFEDNDWCLRASESSAKGCCVCSDSFVWHFGSATFRKTGGFEEAIFANRKRFERKWLGTGDLPKRYGDVAWLAPRPQLLLSAITESEQSRLSGLQEEMRRRGVQLSPEEAVEVPVDTDIIPDGDGFYELCDAIEHELVREAAAKLLVERPNISVCMIVKNEESLLGRCLASVAPLARQLVLVDTGSTDATIAVAQEYGAEIYQLDGIFDFSKARNLSLSKARCEWIFVIDADECLLPADVNALRMATEGPDVAHMVSTRVYQTNPKIEGLIPNDSMHPGTADYCGFVLSTKIRLWPRNSMLEFRNEVHETVEQSAIEAGLSFKTCEAVVHHFGGREMTDKDELYATLGMEKVRNDPCYRTNRELGLQLYRMGRFDEAISAIKEAMEFEPGDVECAVLLGASLAASAKKSTNPAEYIKQAESSFLAALGLDCENELANRYYATFLNQQRRFKEARWHYEKVVARAIERGDTKTLCDFAYACQNLGQPDEAIELLEKAASVNQNYVESTGILECAYHMSGVLAGRAGDMQKAVQRFQKALEIRPDFQEARHNLAIAERWAFL